MKVNEDGCVKVNPGRREFVNEIRAHVRFLFVIEKFVALLQDVWSYKRFVCMGEMLTFSDHTVNVRFENNWVSWPAIEPTIILDWSFKMVYVFHLCLKQIYLSLHDKGKQLALTKTYNEDTSHVGHAV